MNSRKGERKQKVIFGRYWESRKKKVAKEKIGKRGWLSGRQGCGRLKLERTRVKMIQG